MKKREYTIEIGGKTLTAEFSDLADQANGSVILRYGNTVVLATATMSKHPKEGAGWFPLTVDYEEKFYAAGQILGSRYVRREGRPSEEAILSARVVDRTIRPLFDQYIRNDIQVVITVLSIDKDDPDILAINAASLALATSNIPWNGPVSAVRIAKHKNEEVMKINPGYDYRGNENAEFEMIVCGKDENINMIEAGAKEIPENLAGEAFEEAVKEIERMQAFQKMIIDDIGKEKAHIEKPEPSTTLKELFEAEITPKLDAAVFSGPGKKNMEALKEEWMTLAKERLDEEEWGLADDYYEEKVDELIHNEAIDNNRRADGRGMDEVRELYAQAGGVSPILHGSGIFYRGGTHILSALTLGGPGESQIIDGIEPIKQKRFMHHYNFPPFSSGETGRIGGVNRRMIGHGALAEKALSAVLPPQDEFPYTIRIVSESMASNGSTSMASVCGGSLALMDAGVPIKAPVAGIAMGLMMRNEKEYKVLTDIQGPEDHHGDMDFKVAGTREGITAIQMDVKVEGIPIHILKEALEGAKKARHHILDVIEEELAHPRKEISPSAPKIISIKINPEFIGLVIGPGGKTINKIKEETEADIDIEDDGTVYITGKNGAAEKARGIIEEMTHEYKAGERFDHAVVTKIVDFGAFVKIGPNTEGLVHISEIAPFRVEKVSDVLKVGDVVPVIIKEIDDKDRINLSIKAADPNFISDKK